MNMLKKYFHKCDQNLVKSVSTLANVKTCQVCTDSGISTETSEKYFNQSVSPQSSKFLSILKLILNICIFTRQTQRPMANYLLIVFLMFQSKQMLFVIILQGFTHKAASVLFEFMNITGLKNNCALICTFWTMKLLSQVKVS